MSGRGLRGGMSSRRGSGRWALSGEVGKGGDGSGRADQGGVVGSSRIDQRRRDKGSACREGVGRRVLGGPGWRRRGSSARAVVRGRA